MCKLSGRFRESSPDVIAISPKSRGKNLESRRFDLNRLSLLRGEIPPGKGEPSKFSTHGFFLRGSKPYPESKPCPESDPESKPYAESPKPRPESAHVANRARASRASPAHRRASRAVLAACSRQKTSPTDADLGHNVT